MVNNSGTEVVPVEAAGGYVVKAVGDRIYVLMIFRRGCWDLPKGKIDPGETPAECAVREVAEETGAEDLAITRGAGMTVHKYRENGQSIIKTTWWFVMTTSSEEFTPETREQIEQVQWVDWDRARDIVGYENLRQHMDRLGSLVEEFKRELVKRDGATS